MSLLVWLPLNGDLHNLGLYGESIFTTNNATSNDNGKIGKCYSFNGTSSYLIADFTPGTIVPNEMSFCCWVKLSAINKTHTLFCSRPTVGAGLSFFIMNSNKLRFDNGNNQNNSTYLTTFDYIFAANIWYHIAVIQTNTLKKLYINGILLQSINKASANLGSNTAIKGSIGASGANDASANYLSGYLNDVRIYNHALSNKEVEEISKGLILHYKLDGPLSGINENYLENSSLSKKVNNIPSVSSSYTQTFETIDGYSCFHIHSDKLKVTTYLGWDVSSIINSYPIGTKFTLSGWIKTENIVKGTTNYFAALYYGGAYNNNGTSTWIGEGSRIETNTFSSAIDLSGKGWTYCYIVSTFKRNDYLNMWADYYLRDFTGDIYLRNFKFEVNDHPTAWVPTLSEMGIDNIIYDSSGYNNDGTITGSLSAIADTARYNCATYFDGANYISNIPIINPDGNLENEFSIFTWIKRKGNSSVTNTMVYRGMVEFYIRENTSMRISWRAANADLSYNKENTWAPSGMTVPLNEWVHVGFTFKDGIFKSYKNGVYTDNSNRQPYILGSYSGENYIGHQENLDAELSDLRIYKTCLSDDLIKELYNTSATIDNLGNAYARELVE